MKQKQVNLTDTQSDFVPIPDKKFRKKRKTAVIISIILLLCITSVVVFVISKNKIKAGDIIQFGTYDGHTIVWHVLEVKEDKILILSDEILDVKKFNDTNYAAAWENSSIRTWLNDDFYHTAFTKEERSKIVKTTVENTGNFKYGVSSKNDTKDNIFLLSIYEIEDYFGDRRPDLEGTLGVTAVDSAEALSDGYVYSMMSFRWWTRTSGNTSSGITCVSDEIAYGSNQSVDESYEIVNASKAAGIRPALWIYV